MRYPISSFNDCRCVSVHLIGVPDGSWPFFLSGDFPVALLGVTPCEGLLNRLSKPGEIWDITTIVTQESNQLSHFTNCRWLFFCKACDSCYSTGINSVTVP